MSTDQKIYSVKCKECGEQIEFPGGKAYTEQRSPDMFAVYQAFDPRFPGRIRCGKCGDTSSYQEADVRQINLDQ